MKQLPQIYCDMDQVLVNFLDGANKVLSMKGLRNFPDEEKESKWNALKSVSKFWVNLDWMPDGRPLWKFIRVYDPIILSTPSRRMMTSRPEKVEWIRKNLGRVKEIHLVPRDQKQNYAVDKDGQPNLLIDDHIKNINEWVAKGGIGIRHINTMKTVSQLRKLGY